MLKKIVLALLLPLCACGNDEISKIVFNIELQSSEEFIIEIEPLETQKYIGETTIGRENQEEFDKDKNLKLTNEKKADKILENGILYRLTVYETELLKNPDISDQLHKHLGKQIYSEEITFNNNSTIDVNDD